MMNKYLSLLLLLTACSDPSDVTQPTLVEIDGGGATPPLPKVDAAVSDAGTDALPCVFHVDSLEPTTVLAGQAHNTVVLAHGCGFTNVLDVEVSVASVPFRVLNDSTLVFLAAQEPYAVGSFTLPYRAEVDIIKSQPNQVQTWITLQ